MSGRPRRAAATAKKVVYVEEKEEAEIDLPNSEDEAADDFVPDENLDLSEDSDIQNEGEESADETVPKLRDSKTQLRKNSSLSSASLRDKILKNSSFLQNLELGQPSTSSAYFQQLSNLSESSDSDSEAEPRTYPSSVAVEHSDHEEHADAENVDGAFWSQNLSALGLSKSENEKSQTGEKGKAKRQKGRKDKTKGSKELTDVKKLLKLGENLEGDLEEVKVSTSTVPREGIEIRIAVPDLRRNKKQKVDVKELLRRHLRKLQRDLQLNLHKAHICCLIAHGLYLNQVANSEVLRATAMSVLPFKPPERSSLSYVENLVRWFSKKYCIANENSVLPRDLLSDILLKVESEVFHSYAEFVLFFIILLRAGGVDARLVMSLQPLKLKPQTEANSNGEETPKKKGTKSKKMNDNSSDCEEGGSRKRKGKSKSGGKQNKKAKKEESSDTDSDAFEEVEIPDVKLNEEKKKVSGKRGGPEKVSPTKPVGKSEPKRTMSSVVGRQGNKSTKAMTSASSKTDVKSPYFGKSSLESDEEPLSKRVKSAKKSSESPNPPLLSPQKFRASISHGNAMPHLEKAASSPEKKRGKGDISVERNAPKLRSTPSKQGDNDTNGHVSGRNNRNISATGNQRKSSGLTSSVPGKIDEMEGQAGKTTEPIKERHQNRSKIAKNTLKAGGKRSGNADEVAVVTKLDTVKAEPNDSVPVTFRNGSKAVTGPSNVTVPQKKPNLEAIRKLVNGKAKNESKKVLSSDSEPEPAGSKRGYDYWAEAYLEQESKWCPIDVLRGRVFCERELEGRATQPLQYVLAFNMIGTLKDVTSRYASDWLTQARKRRVDEEWLKATLAPFCEAETNRSRKEDADITKMLGSKPIPSSITELKGHPLYVLQRHLLKFEAIYPPNALPLGFIRGDPIYARECVHTLHSKDTWIKQARVVRIGEAPYKVVKARPKWDKFEQKMVTDQPLEVFGFWQTEDYVPPVAVDGKVPRNAYGNVELFKPTMLPIGCVHLPQMPGLNRVAKKLDIDCAPAMVGWDFHSGGSHPLFDGWVVCEESQETLLDAWQTAELEAEKREKDKREKRVIGNWRKMIRGVLIRERLKEKYNLNNKEDVA